MEEIKFPKPMMKKGELVEMGVPLLFLERVWNTPGQKIAFKTTDARRGGCIVYYTPGLKSFIEKCIKQDQRRRELI